MAVANTTSNPNHGFVEQLILTWNRSNQSSFWQFSTGKMN